MKQFTAQDVAWAARRLSSNDDYKLVFACVAQEFEREVQRALKMDPGPEVYRILGQANALQFVLKLMKGDEADADAKTSRSIA